MRVLVLGITGMLGRTVFKVFSQDQEIEVWGTLRSPSALKYFSDEQQEKIISGIDALDIDSLARVMGDTNPDVVVNCVGLIKQLSESNDPLITLPLNSILPHRLAALCKVAKARLIHVSTDCVFDGLKGMYQESDVSNASDLYGKSKYIGEVHNEHHVITLRTSIIGHELNSKKSLVDWFLSQGGSVKGYRNAIFSGLPTVELAHIIKNLVIPRKGLWGLYHVSAEPIDKFSLLNLIAQVYGKSIVIEPDDVVRIDRSLNSEKFRKLTGYVPPSWPELIKKMHGSRDMR